MYQNKQILDIYIDGASQGNPGESGIGIAIYDGSRNLVKTYREYIGNATNNVAEYTALLRALQNAQKLQAKRVLVHSDSELLVRQMKGIYRLKDSKLKILCREARYLLAQLKNVSFKHVSRAENKLADRLAKEAIKKKISPHAQKELFFGLG